jgi:hypothetical protein
LSPAAEFVGEAADASGTLRETPGTLREMPGALREHWAQVEATTVAASCAMASPHFITVPPESARS